MADNVLLKSLHQYEIAAIAADVDVPWLNAIVAFLGLSSIDEMLMMSRTDEISLVQLLNNKAQQECSTLQAMISSNSSAPYSDMKQRWQRRQQELLFLSDLKNDFLSVANFFSEGYFAALFLRAQSSPERVDEIQFTEPVSQQEFYICLDQLKDNANLFNAFLQKLNLDSLNLVFDNAMGMCNWKLLMALYSPGRFDQSHILQLMNMLDVPVLSDSPEAQQLRVLITSQQAKPNHNTPGLFGVLTTGTDSGLAVVPTLACGNSM